MGSSSLLTSGWHGRMCQRLAALESSRTACAHCGTGALLFAFRCRLRGPVSSACALRVPGGRSHQPAGRKLPVRASSALRAACSPGQTHQTRRCRPPELLLGSQSYGPEVDVWSAGCILYEMLAGAPLFGGNKEAIMLSRIMDMLGPLNWEASEAKHIPAARDLKQCASFVDAAACVVAPELDTCMRQMCLLACQHQSSASQIASSVGVDTLQPILYARDPPPGLPTQTDLTLA
jgi:Protein kinase domain